MSVIISAQERKDLRKIIEVKVGKLISDRSRQVDRLKKRAEKEVDASIKDDLACVRSAFEDAMRMASKMGAVVSVCERDNQWSSTTANVIKGVSHKDRDARVRKSLSAMIKECGLRSDLELRELQEDLCLEVIVSGITSDDARSILSRIPSGVAK